ncbi:hypothetical protein [Bacillus sp. T33-2]|nr:hypothetical protein [Bacillus sp. T33-2]
MSNWVTPEEKIRRKQKKKVIVFVTCIVVTMILSGLVTYMVNQI